MNSFFSKNADFPTSVADLRLGIIDATKLTWGDALNRRVGMDVIPLIVEADGTRHEMVNMSHLELDRPSPNLSLVGRGVDSFSAEEVTSPLPTRGGLGEGL